MWEPRRPGVPRTKSADDTTPSIDLLNEIHDFCLRTRLAVQLWFAMQGVIPIMKLKIRMTVISLSSEWFTAV